MAKEVATLWKVVVNNVNLSAWAFDVAGADEKEKVELYNQALASYQGTLRRATVARSVTRAVEAKQAEVENLKKLYPKPDDNAKIKIEEAIAGVEQFKKIEGEFAANKDYDAFISYRIGLCLLELNRHWEAFVAFRDIFDNNPGFSKVSGAYYYYILALRQIGRNTEAQAKCKEFLQKYPDSDEVSAVAVILGEISQDREDYKEAIEHYNWAKSNVKKIDASTVEEIDFRIITCLFANGHVLLEGVPGLGKTLLIRTLSQGAGNQVDMAEGGAAGIADRARKASIAFCMVINHGFTPAARFSGAGSATEPLSTEEAKIYDQVLKDWEPDGKACRPAFR